jgi:hypothetical protein
MKQNGSTLDEIRMLQSSAMGYGSVSESCIKEGLKHKPDIIVGQGTSSDPGPAYLASDDIHGYVGKTNKKRDISLIVKAGKENGIPFVFSGSSPSGSDRQLEGLLRIVHEIALENNFDIEAAVISGEINKDWLIKKIEKGAKAKRIVNTPRLSECLTVEEVLESKRVVAQMGPEPIMEGLRLNLDGVITGRALDVGLHMAFPLLHDFEKGLVAHMGKTIECGALCADPPINENIFAILRRNYFLVFPLSSERRCTVSSVAAHAFYERPDISKEMNPGGYLDITKAKYEQYDDKTVKAYGGEWVSMPYTIKLEGVKEVGSRTITIAGLRDPNLVKHIDGFLADVKDKAVKKFPHDDFKLTFHIYGKNAVLKTAEPVKEHKAHELGLVVSVIAKSQEAATAICAYVRGQLHFGQFPGRTSSAGNIATLFSPAEIEMGKAHEWSIWHALELDDYCEPFKMKTMKFPNPEWLKE